MRLFKSKEQRNLIVFLITLAIITLILYARTRYIMSQCTRVTIGTVERTTFVNDSAVKTVYFNIDYNGEKLTIEDDYGGEIKMRAKDIS